jgi:hypothetical protein
MKLIVRVLDGVYGANVRMVKSRCGARFKKKSIERYLIPPFPQAGI